MNQYFFANMAVNTPPNNRNLIRDLLVLSRFHKYNPIFACFAGLWGTLLAGAAKLAEDPVSITPGHVWKQSGLVFLASYAFCGAGMVWDDWVDRDIDIKVARTKDRPIAAGRVTTFEAMLWMLVQSAASWALLEVMLDGKDVLLHFAPVAAASVLYPYLKRPFWNKCYFYPQYILGFTIGWPMVIGWAAIHGQEETFAETCLKCVPVCVMTFFWTIYLNTAYSYQDVVDDRKMGVNSMYNLFGKHIKLLLVALVIPMFVSMPIFLSKFQSTWLWIAWMGVWSVSFLEQLYRFDGKKPASGGTVHKKNFLLGIWTIIACAVEVYLTNEPILLE